MNSSSSFLQSLQQSESIAQAPSEVPFLSPTIHRKIAFPFTLGLVYLLQACAFSDLRPSQLREFGPSIEMEQRGRELLDRAIEATGGRQAWDSFQSAEMHFQDEWGGWIGYLYRPWPENPTELLMHYDFPMQAAEGRFLSGSHLGETWGLDEHGTWFQAPDGQRVQRPCESIRFMFAAYQYFFELPLRISEAPIVSYAGNRQRAGRQYDLVFATWGKPEPHAAHDQYLLWIAKDSGLIEIAQYTIRDKFRFVKGANRFSDFRTVDGIVIPHSYWISRSLEDEDFVHRVQIEELRFIRSAAKSL